MNFVSENEIDMVDTRSNMQLSDLNFKPHGRKGLTNIIDSAIVARFFTPPVSEHYKLLRLDRFHGPFHINCEKNEKSEIIMNKISNTCNRTMKPRENLI